MKKMFNKIAALAACSAVIIGSGISGTTSLNASAAKNVKESAVQWAVNIANDKSHGYSQAHRNGPDYDCSSLVITAYKKAGAKVGGATYTGNMKSEMTKYDFKWIPWSQIGSTSKLQRGDILWKNGHTEMYIGNNKNVGAHQDYGNPKTGDQNGKEISVTNYYGGWTGVLRYKGTGFSSYTVKLKKGTKVYTAPGSGKVAMTINADGVFTIVDEQTASGVKYGKLKSGAGWVKL